MIKECLKCKKKFGDRGFKDRVLCYPCFNTENFKHGRWEVNDDPDLHDSGGYNGTKIECDNCEGTGWTDGLIYFATLKDDVPMVSNRKERCQNCNGEGYTYYA